MNVPVDRIGLCPGCSHVRVVTSGRGSRFLLCGHAAADPRYPKYPPQPLERCAAYRASDGQTAAADGT